MKLSETTGKDHLVTCGIPYANTYEIPLNSGKFYCKKYRGIPRNSAEFRMFFKKFRIPSEVKNELPWTPYMPHLISLTVVAAVAKQKVLSFPMLGKLIAAPFSMIGK